MEEKKEKLEDAVKIIKDQDESLGEEQIETVEGGAGAGSNAAECSCDCWISNSNSGQATKSTQDSSNTIV